LSHPGPFSILYRRDKDEKLLKVALNTITNYYILYLLSVIVSTFLIVKYRVTLNVESRYFFYKIWRQGKKTQTLHLPPSLKVKLLFH